jgi:dCMP deaminase
MDTVIDRRWMWTPDRMAQYLDVAESIAKLSKGRNTRVGAVIVSPDRTIRATGYNGAPRGCSADEHDDPRSLKPEKLYWVVHAELNAIASAAANGTSLAGSTIIVTHQPCMACAAAIVQAGIRRVITNRPSGQFAVQWKADLDRSTELFKECNVEMLYV